MLKVQDITLRIVYDSGSDGNDPQDWYWINLLDPFLTEEGESATVIGYSEPREI